MIALATGNATAEAQGAKIIVTIPSGKDAVQIALTPHQAMMLAKRTTDAARDAFNSFPASTGAEIVPFERRA